MSPMVGAILVCKSVAFKLMILGLNSSFSPIWIVKKDSKRVGHQILKILITLSVISLGNIQNHYQPMIWAILVCKSVTFEFSWWFLGTNPIFPILTGRKDSKRLSNWVWTIPITSSVMSLDNTKLLSTNGWGNSNL